MLERRAALRGLALAPLALLALPAAFAPADPDDEPDEGDDGGEGDGGQSEEDDAAPEDNGHRPLGYGVTFTAFGVRVEVAAVSCAPAAGFITTPTGGKLWEAQIAVHVVSGDHPEIYLPGSFNFRAFYGDQPFQYYLPEYSGAGDSLAVMLKNIKAGDRITGKIRFMADRGPIQALGFYVGSVERFAPSLFWDVPQPVEPPKQADDAGF